MTASRVALVTGASSGFGQATAAQLAAQGFQVFGTSRAPTPDSAGTYDMLPLDVGSETSVQAFRPHRGLFHVKVLEHPPYSSLSLDAASQAW